MIVEPTIVRPSSLADSLDCPRRFAARHLKDLLASAGYTVGGPRPSHIGASVGTGLHAGAAATLIERLRTGADLPAADAEALAIEEMRQRMATEGVTWDEVTQDTNTAERQLRRMMVSWQRHVAPTVRPQLVEERLEVEIAPGLHMSGQLDVADTAGNALRVRDNKTTKHRRAAHAQLGAYGLLLHSHGWQVAGLAIDHIPRVKISDEQPVPETREIPLREAISDAMQAVEDIGRRIETFRQRAADARSPTDPISAFPANPGSALCNPRYCPAHGTNACRIHT